MLDCDSKMLMIDQADAVGIGGTDCDGYSPVRVNSLVNALSTWAIANGPDDYVKYVEGRCVSFKAGTAFMFLDSAITVVAVLWARSVAGKEKMCCC